MPPGGESLEMTANRALPCLFEEIVPLLEVGKTVLVAAHGNSLRSLVMEIEGLSPEAIVEREIPTGTPMAYSLTSGVWSKLGLNGKWSRAEVPSRSKATSYQGRGSDQIYQQMDSIGQDHMSQQLGILSLRTSQ